MTGLCAPECTAISPAPPVLQGGKLKIRKIAAPLAALMGAALVLSSCASPQTEEKPKPTASETESPEEPGEEPVDDEIFYTVGSQAWGGYNGNTPANYAVSTSVINARTASGFIHYGPAGEIERDTDFGTFEALSEDPLVVEYKVNDGVTFSDGNEIDYADALLDWASQNPAFVGEDGKPLFNHVSQSLGEYVTKAPEGEIGGKTFTYNFDEVFADWQLLISGFFPAHIVAEQIGVTEDELAQAILDADMDIIAKAAEFWNTGWDNPAPGQLPDEKLIPVSGPFTFSEWKDGEYLTLVRNDDYWGTPAGVSKLTFRFTDDANTVQALANGDLDVIEPQPTVDTLKQLEALGADFKIETGDTLTWEHFDFNHKAGVFQDNLALREALAYCLPRQDIVDNLVKPTNPDAVIMNAREKFPFQEGYAEYVAASYDGRYDVVDIEKAKAKIAESGVATPVTVQVLYVDGNQRRADEVAALKSSCDQAGFDIQASPEPGASYSDRLEQTDGALWDLALFAWAGSGQIASGQNIYATDRAQNFGGFSNADVDAAWKTLASTADPKVHAEQAQIIDKLLWDNLFGIPVFAHPGLVGYDATIQNVKFTSTQDQIVWNAQEWIR